MKLDSVLIFLILNSICWSLINSVKDNKNQNELARVEETSKDLNKILNDGAESSVAHQIEKYRETLKPNNKITIKHKTENKEEETRLKKSEYMKDYYQQHKKEKQDYKQNYLKNNKEKTLQYNKDYYQKNRDRVVQSSREYRQNNKEKRRDCQRKYYLKKKKEREILQKGMSKIGNIQPDNNEGTSFVSSQNDDFTRKNTTRNNEDEKKLAKKEYNKNYNQKNKEKRKEYDRKYHLKRKNKKENSQNDNYINKGKSPIECNENIQVSNKEGNDDVTQQSDDLISKDTTVNNEDKIKLAKKEYYKNYYQKNKEKKREYKRKYNLKRKNEKENLHNDNYINKGKSTIESNENVQLNNKGGHDNTQENSFVNPQMNDYVLNNIQNPTQENGGEDNVQTANANFIRQIEDNNDVSDLSFLDDPDFLNNLYS
uniref:Uncharacterized protein n=1 Tax=Meloidogyne enterolobii TaxID=390850 RepID=A0A6V7XJ86_MELEN|nr:unnamed protein product [Meloidogyne enterolobii]